jgi:hypothetical protein
MEDLTPYSFMSPGEGYNSRTITKICNEIMKDVIGGNEPLSLKTIASMKLTQLLQEGKIANIDAAVSAIYSYPLSKPII